MKSSIEIRFWMYTFRREGSFVLKSKENKTTSNKKRKSKKISNQWKWWFLKNIQYDVVQIDEKVGALTPFVTSIILPVVATLTTIPLQFLKVNYRNFQYHIIPDYEHLIFQLQLDATASFRIVDLLRMYNPNKNCTNFFWKLEVKI